MFAVFFIFVRFRV